MAEVVVIVWTRRWENNHGLGQIDFFRMTSDGRRSSLPDEGVSVIPAPFDWNERYREIRVELDG